MDGRHSVLLEMKGDASSALAALKQTSDSLKTLGSAIQQMSRMTGLDTIEGAFRKLGGVVKDLGAFAAPILRGVGGGILNLLSPLNLVKGAFSALGDVAKIALGIVVGNALIQLSRLFTEVAGQAVTLAGQARDIGQSFQILVGQFGVAGDRLIADMDRVARGTIDSAKLQQIANRALLAGGKEFATALPRLMEIARGATIATGKSFEYVFDTLITGIAKGSPLLIDNAEIYIKLGQAVEQYAAGLGKTVEQLTPQQRMMATLNAVLAQGAFYADTLGRSFESQLAPMQRVAAAWTDLKTQIGTSVLPIAQAGADILNEIIGSVSGFLEKYAPAFEGLGLAIVDGLRSGWEKAKAFLGEIAEALAPQADPAEWLRSGMEIVASLAEGLLTGLSDYVIPAVIAIGNTIADFLLAASPPKKGPLASIVKWGQGLINEYFKGFAKADFGVLGQVGSAIKNALQAAVSLGDLPKEQLIPLFRTVREQAAGLIATFRQTGEISEETLGKIGETLGAGSEDLVKYLRLQLEHQKALKNLSTVQEEYAAAEAAGFVPAELEARLDAAKKAAEAKEDELSWQEALVKAQQDTIDLQTEQVRVLEKLTKSLEAVGNAIGGMGRAVKSAADPWAKFVEDYENNMAVLEEKRRLGLISEDDYLKEMAGLQERYVEQAIRMGKPYDVQLAGLREIQKILKGVGTETETTLSGQVDNMTKKISDAALEWKKKFTEAFEPLRRLGEPMGQLGDVLWGFLKIQKVQPPVAELPELSRSELGKDISEGYKQGSELRKVFDALVEGIKILPDKVREFVQELGRIKSEWWDPLDPTLKKVLLGAITLNFVTGGAVGNVLQGLIIGAFAAAGLTATIEAGALAAVLYIAIKPFLSEEVKQEWAKTWEAFKSGGDVLTVGGKAAETTLEHTPLMDQLLKWTDTSLTPAITNAWNGLKDKATSIWNEAVQGWTTAYNGFTAGIVTGAAIFIAQVVGKYNELKIQATEKFNELKTDVLTKATEIKDAVLEKVSTLATDAVTKLTEFKDNALAKFGEFRDEANRITGEAKDWVVEKIGGIADSFTRVKTAIEEAIGKLGEFLGSLAGAVIPDWLMPGSQTPFELGLWGILGAMQQLAITGQGFFVFRQMRADLETLMTIVIPMFVVNTVTQFTALKFQVVQLVAEMSTAARTLIQVFVSEATTRFNQLLGQVKQIFAQIKATILQLIGEAVQGALESLAEFQEKATEKLEATAAVFEDMASRMADAISEIVGQINGLIGRLDKLIEKANEAKEAMEEAGMLPGSPPGLEVGLEAINQALRRVQAAMGGFPATMQVQAGAMAAAMPGGGGRGGNTYNLGEGAINISLPNVRDGRDAQDLVRVLEELIGQASARASVPGGIG